jgi:predicted RNase H-like HicB family nuclease
MKSLAKYTVTYERDESGWWVANVTGLEGCLTKGRTIEQARERIREALQVWFDLKKPFAGEIVDDVKLPASVRKVVDKANALRAEAREAEEKASARSREAIACLVSEGLSLRDAGELLGITRQRAQKLAS